MKRVRTGFVLAMLAVLTSACSESSNVAQLQTNTVPLNAVHWDELAAAQTSASVNNNNLIFMR